MGPKAERGGGVIQLTGWMALSLLIFVVTGWMDEYRGIDSGMDIYRSGFAAFVVMWCDSERQRKKAWKAMKREGWAA